MSASRVHSNLLAIVAWSGLLMVFTAPPASAESATSTGAFLHGHYSAASLNDTFQSIVSPPYTFSNFNNSLDRIYIKASNLPESWWNFVFAAPPGETLTVGTYTNATNVFGIRSAGVPGIAVSGDSAGCSQYTGSFTVMELTRDASNVLTAAAVSFTETCLDAVGGPLMRGTVRFNSSVTWAGWSIDPGGYWAGFNFGNVVTDTTTQPRTVSISNPSTETIHLSTSVDGTNPSDYGLVDAGNCAGTIDPGASCQFGVTLTPSAKGSRAARLVVASDVDSSVQYVTLVGTGVHVAPTVTLSANPDPGYVGDEITFTVKLNPVPDGGSTALNWSTSADLINRYLGSIPVNSSVDGTYTFKARFSENGLHYAVASYSGTAQYDYAESPVLTYTEIEPPNTFISDYPTTWQPTASATFKFASLTGFYAVAARFDCQIDGSAWSVCESPYSTPTLDDGLHTFGVRGVDANGRIEESPEFVTWHVDTTPPDVGVTLNGGGLWTNNPLVTVNIAATDQSTLQEMRIDNALTYDDQGLLNENGPFQYFDDSTSWDTTYALQHGTPEDGLKTVYVQVSDLLGWWSEIESATITLDRGNPTADQAIAAIATGTLGSTIPVAINWRSATDSVSGVASRNYQRKVGSGRWKDISSGQSLAPATHALTPGTTYRYHQQAVDNATNVGAWSTALVCKPQLRQENAASISRSKNWTRKALATSSAGYVLRSSRVGSWVTTTFTGNSVGWVTTTGPTMGRAAIYLDGSTMPAQTIDLSRASSATRQIVWSYDFGGTGRHTVKVQVLSGPVDLDAFVVLAKP